MDIRELATPLYGAKGWLKLLGVLSIVYGVASALTIVGIIIAWLPIWMGVLLFQSAGAIDIAFNSEDEVSLMKAMGKLKTYFTIMGILALFGLVFGFLAILMGGAGMLAGLAGGT